MGRALGVRGDSHERSGGGGAEHALELLLDLGTGWLWNSSYVTVYDRWTTVSVGDVAEEPPEEPKRRQASASETESIRQALRARFQCRWRPTDADQTLGLDDVARVLGVDAALRAPKLVALLDANDPQSAFGAALALSKLGLFDCDVESVAWALVEGPIPAGLEDRTGPDAAQPSVLNLDARILLGQAMIEHRGGSPRARQCLRS